jgi:hypothetical protein
MKHDAQCESDWIEAHYTPCDCAGRREEARRDEIRERAEQLELAARDYAETFGAKKRR